MSNARPTASSRLAGRRPGRPARPLAPVNGLPEPSRSSTEPEHRRPPRAADQRGAAAAGLAAPEPDTVDGEEGPRPRAAAAPRRRRARRPGPVARRAGARSRPAPGRPAAARRGRRRTGAAQAGERVVEQDDAERRDHAGRRSARARSARGRQPARSGSAAARPGRPASPPAARRARSRPASPTRATNEPELGALRRRPARRAVVTRTGSGFHEGPALRVEVEPDDLTAPDQPCPGVVDGRERQRQRERGDEPAPPQNQILRGRNWLLHGPGLGLP